MNAKAWVLAARPKTLPAAVVPVWTGSLAGWIMSGVFSVPLLLATLGSCVCIQIATNFFNDAIDAGKGADTAERLGPVRATASGLLSARQVMTAAVVACGVAAALGLVLIGARGWPVLAIGTVSLVLAYAYTGGPYPLAYRGLGEVFVVAFFGLVATGGSYFIQTGEWPGWFVVVLGLQVGFYSTVLLCINNLRDRQGDAAADKRTLAVRYGERFALIEIAVFALLPLAGNVLWWQGTGRAGFLTPLLLAPLSALIVRGVWRVKRGRELNRYLALSGVQLLAFGVLFTLGGTLG